MGRWSYYTSMVGGVRSLGASSSSRCIQLILLGAVANMPEDTKCNRCDKLFALDEIYYRLEAVKLYQSQGQPDEYTKHSINCCTDCAHTGLRELRMLVDNDK